MTTLRRELRQRIIDELNKLEAEDILDIGFDGSVDKSAVADRLADSVLEVVNKKTEKPTNDPMWNFLHGIDVTQEEIDDNKLAEEAKQTFEMHMKFNPLPWSSTQAWTKLEKFVVEQYKKDKLIFAKYKTWQQGEGKYDALSNRKIKERPDDFISCFPDFLAHSAMYGQPETQKSDQQTQMFATDDNDIPISY